MRPRWSAPVPVLVVLGLCGGGCAAARPAGREALADGSYRLTCHTSLGSCLSSLGDVCAPRGYEVIRAAEKRDRIGPEPWPTETLSSEAIVRCSARPALVGSSAAPPTAPAAPPAEMSSPKPSRCFPGATQACVGPGGCSGGQACSPDGSAFGACDCGAAPLPQATPSPPEAPSPP